MFTALSQVCLKSLRIKTSKAQPASSLRNNGIHLFSPFLLSATIASPTPVLRASPPIPNLTNWLPSMADTQSVAMLIESTTSKIQQLEKAFAELESHRAISLNLKWKELEEHFHGLEVSLKRRFDELEDKEKEYETKALEAREMLEKREAVVAAKEQASLERLQEKRDAALSTVEVLLQKYKKSSPEPVVDGASNGKPVDVNVEEKYDAKATKNGSEDAKPIKNGALDVKPRSQLVKLCEEMDAKGLHKFIVDNRKILAAIREEVPIALRSATDPARLVLDSLEDFYNSELPSLDGKKDSNIIGLRRTCIMLMESLVPLSTDLKSGSASDSPIISPETKEKAKAIADTWKSKLDDLNIDANNGNSLEARAFLQLLASFGIASDFDQDEICRLLPAVSRRRQTAELCRSLGLSEKMPGLIEVLINNGRQLDAINLAYEFGLTEQYDPVPLLKAYLKEARKASQVKAGNTSAAVQNEANERELLALKSVVKCIEEYKLQEQYPLDLLQKRIQQLEKAKADKKRAAESAKPQPKRPRANGSSNGYGSRFTNVPDKSFYRAPTGPTSNSYPYVYERPGQDLYGPPPALQRPYIYGAENRGSPLLSTSSYNLSPNHATYFGNGYQYQSIYPH